MSEHGVFIEVELDPELVTDGELARQAGGGLPVDIFSGRTGASTWSVRTSTSAPCELCLDAAPAGKLAIRKLYDGTELRRDVEGRGQHAATRTAR